MKKAAVFATIVASVVCSCLFSGVAVADCGKMMIYRHHWRQAPPRPSRQIVINININQGAGSTINFRDLLNNPNILPPPAPEPPRGCPNPEYVEPVTQPERTPSYTSSQDMTQNVESTGDGSNIQAVMDGNKLYGFGTFQESGQRAVIAWNGSDEETLILTTNEKSLSGKGMAMLSVLPLPGEPIAIEEADPEVFNKARKLLISKLPPELGYKFGAVVFTRKIGPHNIFVWKLDNVASFKKEVSAYVAEKYNNQAAALIDANTERIVSEYFKRGFQYFAFDLTIVEDMPANKVAISYRFKSNYVYFPLQISQVGGSKSRTYVDLVIMTPGMIKPTGIVSLDKGNPNKAFITGNQSVPFTKAEVAGLNAELAKVFRTQSVVYAREVQFEGELNSFNGDFTAENYQP